MPAGRVLLFSGMGGDGRLFRDTRIPGLELVTPSHVEPTADEDLVGYASRVAARYGIGIDDVVGGASFGGMLAAQMAFQRGVAGLIMLGSCFDPACLRPYHRWLERAARLLPDSMLGLRAWGPLVRWRFAPLTPEAEACLLAMSADCPPLLLRRVARMIIGWPGVARPSCPTLVIHGARDRFIPASGVQTDLLLPDAGHAFTLTHAEPTNSAIRDFLARL